MRQRPLRAAFGLLLAATVLLAAADAWAVAVTGTITAAGQPVAEATVTLEPEDPQRATAGPIRIPVGRDGRLQGDAPPGSYRLQIRAPGHRTIDERVVVQAGQTVNLSRTLQARWRFSLGAEFQYHDIDTKATEVTVTDLQTGQSVTRGGEGITSSSEIIQGGVRAGVGIPFRVGALGMAVMPWAGVGGSHLRIESEEGGSRSRFSGDGAYVSFGLNLRMDPPGSPVSIMLGANGDHHFERDMSFKGDTEGIRDIEVDADATRFVVFALVTTVLNKFGVGGSLGNVGLFAGVQGQWYCDTIDARFTATDQFGSFPVRLQKDHEQRGVFGGKAGITFPIPFVPRTSGRAEGAFGDGYHSFKFEANFRF